MEQAPNNSFYPRGKVWKAASVTLALLSLFLFAKIISEIKGWGFIGADIAPQTTITVAGKGEVLAKPDIATFSFGIQDESSAVATAQTSVAKSENAVLSFLDKSGVSKDDVKVSGYNIYPRYDYTGGTPYGGGKQVLAAYVVSESVEVKVRALADAGKIIGGLGALGATNVSGLTFGIDKQDDVMKEARAKAIADAKNNAESLAHALGVSLVRVVNFSDNNNPYPIYYAKSAALDSGGLGAAPATPELPSGTNKITSNVSVVYEIR